MSPTLQSILGPETLAAFETPGPVLRGLPAAAYTSEAFFALENERLFSESWVFAGFAHELPGRGDAAPVTVAGRPMLLGRCADHEVRAFHPRYFGGRDASAAPAGFDREQHGPVPAKVETWYDWIFINLNGNGPPFEEFVARLLRRLDGLDLASMQHLVTIDLGEVAANWKLLIENFFEPHHGQLAHAATASQPLADRYIANDPGCPGCRRRHLRRGEANRRSVGRLPLSHAVPEFCVRAPPPGSDRRAPQHASGAGPYPPAPRDLQPRSRPGSGRTEGAARSAPARGVSRSPDRLRVAPARNAVPMQRPRAACSLLCGRTPCAASRNLS